MSSSAVRMMLRRAATVVGTRPTPLGLTFAGSRLLPAVVCNNHVRAYSKKGKKGGSSGSSSSLKLPALTFEKDVSPVDLDKLQKSYQACVDGLAAHFSTLRTGQATPAVLDDVHIDFQGDRMPLRSIAQIAVKGTNQLIVTVFDHESAKQVVEAVKSAGISSNPVLEDYSVRIHLPKLTMDYRQNMAKLAKDHVEGVKHRIRGVRNKAVQHLKKTENVTEDDSKKIEKYIQDMQDVFIQQVEHMLETKTKEILSEK